MCYAGATGQSSASSGGFVDWLLTVVSVVLLIFLLTGCMTIKNAQLEVKNEGGTVNVMTKTVTVPSTVTIPATALGL